MQIVDVEWPRQLFLVLAVQFQDRNDLKDLQDYKLLSTSLLKKFTTFRSQSELKNNETGEIF